MSSYYPAFLDLRDRLVIVVGGGAVAERKVSALLAAGALVRVISPELTPRLRRLAGEGAIEAHQHSYQSGDFSGAHLAIVATDDTDLNRRAALDARAERVLVNTVDDVAYCDFIAPAVVQQGDVTVAVSTNGKSPAMARFLRQQLEEYLTPEYADLLEVMEQVRHELRRQKTRVPAERWQEQIDDGLRELVRRGDLEGAKERLLAGLLGAGVASS